MALKNLLSTMKSDTVLVGEIDRYLMKPNKGSGFVKDERAKGVWHPSQLARCERSLIFEMMKFPATSSQVSALGQRIFDVGHHFGYMIQEYLYDMGILYGEWKCRECGHRWLDMFENPSPRKCPNCEKDMYIWYNLDYLEIPIKDAEYNVVGHADGLIKTLGKFRVLELKTIKNRTAGTHPKSETYDDLNAPKEAHLWQTQIYMHFINKMAEKELKSVTDGVILYGAKNDQGLKEFKIKLMHDLYVQPQLDKIRKMEEHIDNGTLPDRPEGCTSRSSWDCKYCGYNMLCYTTDSNKINDYEKGE